MAQGSWTNEQYLLYNLNMPQLLTGVSITVLETTGVSFNGGPPMLMSKGPCTKFNV